MRSGGGLETENAYPRDEELPSQSWHGTTAISPATLPATTSAAANADAVAATPSFSSSTPCPFPYHRETGETYIFPLYTLPMFIPFSRLQRFQIHVIKLAGSAACAHAKYIYTDR